MARVRVATDRFKSGRLPDVCSRTGKPTTSRAQVRAVYTPDWIWILLLFGIVPFVLAYYFTRRQVDGAVPLSSEALDRARNWSRLAQVALVLLVAVIFVPAVVQIPVLAQLVLVTAVALGALFVLGVVLAHLNSVTARLSADGQWVTLQHVHRRFIEVLAEVFQSEYGAAGRSSLPS